MCQETEGSPPRSRRGLFQSVSSTNLAAPPSSSLPPQVPRSFYLGDLDLAARLRGSRSLHNSPAHTCGLGRKYDSHHHHHGHRQHGDSNQRTYSSLSPAPGDHCATPDSELPRGVADALRHLDVPLTSELADTNHSNSARNRNESHLLNYIRYGGALDTQLHPWVHTNVHTNVLHYIQRPRPAQAAPLQPGPGHVPGRGLPRHVSPGGSRVHPQQQAQRPLRQPEPRRHLRPRDPRLPREEEDLAPRWSEVNVNNIIQTC